MAEEALRVQHRPALTAARMVVGLSGWMDGGDVSTGTVDFLRNSLGAKAFAHIAPDTFHIYNFPGSMEVSALFRPHCKVVDGRIEHYAEPRSEFLCSEAHNLILFKGREPNLNWPEFARSVLTVVRDYGVETVLFAGSVAGVVPHTRPARVRASASDDAFLHNLQERFGVGASDYEGPASIITYLTTLARGHGVNMASLVAEIPAYVQGKNPRCVETMSRLVCSILGLAPDFSELALQGDEFERRLSEVVVTREDLAELVRRMEEDYDAETGGDGMDDLRDWFENQGIRLD